MTPNFATRLFITEFTNNVGKTMFKLNIELTSGKISNPLGWLFTSKESALARMALEAKPRGLQIVGEEATRK